jgi:hypothetical protein
VTLLALSKLCGPVHVASTLLAATACAHYATCTRKSDANEVGTNEVDTNSVDTNRVSTHLPCACATTALWSNYFETFLSESSESESESESSERKQSDHDHGSMPKRGLAQGDGQTSDTRTEVVHGRGMVACMHREKEGRHGLVLLAALMMREDTDDSDSPFRCLNCTASTGGQGIQQSVTDAIGSLGLHKWSRCACCVRLFSSLCAISALCDAYGCRLRGYADLVEIILTV